MGKVKKRLGHKRRELEPQEVRPVQRVLVDEDELLIIVKGRLVLPERGGIPLMKVLDQEYDQPNVVALDLLLGEREQRDIRKLDQALERKLQSMLKGKEAGSGPHRTYRLRVRLTAVLS